MPTQHNYYGEQFSSLEDFEARIRELAEKDGTLTDRERDLWNALNEAAEELRARKSVVDEIVARGDSRNFENGASFHTARPGATDAPHGHDGAMRTLERHSNAGRLTGEAVDRVDGVLRGPDAGFGLDAAYVEAAGSEAYERAFAEGPVVTRRSGELARALESPAWLRLDRHRPR